MSGFALSCWSSPKDTWAIELGYQNTECREVKEWANWTTLQEIGSLQRRSRQFLKIQYKSRAWQFVCWSLPGCQGGHRSWWLVGTKEKEQDWPTQHWTGCRRTSGFQYWDWGSPTSRTQCTNLYRAGASSLAPRGESPIAAWTLLLLDSQGSC